MKLKIYDENSINETDDKQLFVRLEKLAKHDDIILMVVDKNGITIKGGNLLSIDQDIKCIVFCNDIHDSVPLKTDFKSSLLNINNDEYQDNIRESSMKDMFRIIGECAEQIEQKEQIDSVKH